ncbi:Kinase, NEK [Giardia muris]|uniref:Kinase, NEK n=1 Tax=Giardia muris TaxID=5742 RepID=A0A4Z1T2Q1_GIAMU|nr:Kinase, NEK [Giardia muris]|eukprot:TNJ29928.1 Kinase, NEK [Giardia muris]
MTSKKTLPEPYLWMKSLSKWPCGEVYLASRKTDGQTLAIKEISLGHVTDEAEKSLLLEDFRRLPSYNHPNLIQYYDVIYDSDTDVVYLVMEYIPGGSLRDEVNFRRDYRDHYAEATIWEILCQVIDALIYIHSRKSPSLARAHDVFQNVKSSNILLMERNDQGEEIEPGHISRRIKLTDYGFLRLPTSLYAPNISYSLYQMAHYPPELMELASGDTLCGSRDGALKTTQSLAISSLSAPGGTEVWYSGVKADIWSLACLLLELCNLCKPKFMSEGRNIREFFKKNVGIKLCKGYSSDVMLFLSKTLLLKPSARTGLNDLIDLVINLRDATERLGGLQAEDYFCSRCRTKDAEGAETIESSTQFVPRCKHCLRNDKDQNRSSDKPNIIARFGTPPDPIKPPNWPTRIVTAPTALIKACQAGNAAAAKKAIKDAGAVLATGLSALMCCARSGLREVVELLVEREYGIRQIEKTEKHEAETVTTQEIKEYNDIIGKANPNQPPLRDDPDKVALLKKTVYGELIVGGPTAMMQAYEAGHYDIVSLLAPYEARHVTRYGKTTLMRAAIDGNIPVIQALLPFEAGIQDIYGQTALMLALQNGKEDAARLLLASEAGYVDRYQVSSLMLALDHGFPETALLLIEKEAGVQDSSGKTALMRAVEHGYIQAMQLLATQEAGLRDKMRVTALHIAAEKNDLDAAQLVVEREKTCRTNRGETALHIATRLHFNDLASFLLTYEAGYKNGDGITALQYCCLHDYRDMVPMFLGRETMIYSNDDKLAIELAFEMLHLPIVRLLIPYEGTEITESRGARRSGNSITSTINDGYNSLHQSPTHEMGRHSTQVANSLLSSYQIYELDNPAKYSRSLSESMQKSLRNVDTPGQETLAQSLRLTDELLLSTGPSDSLYLTASSATRLIQAVHENNLFKVFCLAESQAKMTDSAGRTALMHAAILNRLKCLEFLVDFEANMRCARGYNALAYACICGNEDAIRFLAQYEAVDQSRYSKVGNRKTELMVAAEQDDVCAVWCLKNYLRMTNTDGMFALMYAVERNNYNCVRFLLKEKDMELSDGTTAHQRAIELGHDQCAYLIAIAFSHVVLDGYGNTQLMCACMRGDIRTAMKFKAQAGIQNNEGKTALMIAAEQGYHQLVEVLLEVEARMVQLAPKPIILANISCNGLTALMYAAANDNERCVELLIPKEVGGRTDRGVTALMLAASAGAVCAVEKIAKTTEPGASTDEGMTATMYAARCALKDVLAILKDVEAGAVTTTSNEDYGPGITALMLAAMAGSIDCLKALRKETGIATPTTNRKYPSWTALAFACAYGNVNCATALLEKEGAQSRDVVLELIAQDEKLSKSAIGAELTRLIKRV